MWSGGLAGRPGKATQRRADEWLKTCIQSRQEINDLKHFLVLGGLLMSAALIAPAALMANDHHGEKRYYDRDGHDYHYWNDGEDRQYRAYLVEQHRVYVPFVRISVRHRQEYFRYRHEHGFKVEVR
jgi:hypothetical protein